MQPKRNPKLWIQEAIRKGRKGALSRQLGIPEKDNIPIALLRAIKHADIGETVDNPTVKGKKWIKITRLLKHRGNLALTLKGMRKSRTPR